MVSPTPPSAEARRLPERDDADQGDRDNRRSLALQRVGHAAFTDTLILDGGRLAERFEARLQRARGESIRGAMGSFADMSDLLAEHDHDLLGIDPDDPREQARRAVRPPLRRRSIVIDPVWLAHRLGHRRPSGRS